MKKIIGYARVSTSEQSINSHALSQQKARLESLVDEIYFDIDSGRKSNRRQYLQLKKLVQEQEVSKIVVTRLDRISRSLVELKGFIDECEKNKVELMALDNQIDTGSAVGKFQIALLGALAEMESDQLSERVKHGINYRIKKERPFKPPFGYTIQNDKLVFDEEPFLCLLSTQETYSKYDIGCELIRQYLKIKSVTSCRFWMLKKFGFKKTQIAKWIKNPCLIGDMYYPSQNKWVFNSHEPLLDKEIIEEARRLTEFNALAKGKTNKIKYNLSGLIYCRCGAKASIDTMCPKTTTNTYIYVRCSLRGRCTTKASYVVYDNLEQQVFAKITQEASNLSEIIGSETRESNKLKGLKKELEQLDAIKYPHPAIIQARNDLRQEIEKEKYHNIYDCNNKQLFIDTFSDPDFWLFFKELPLVKRHDLIRRFVKKIIFNPFSIEFND